MIVQHGGYLSETGGSVQRDVRAFAGNVLLATTSVGGSIETYKSGVQLRGASVGGDVLLDRAQGLAVVCGTTIGRNLLLVDSDAHADLCGNRVGGRILAFRNSGTVWISDNSQGGDRGWWGFADRDHRGGRRT